MGLHDYVLASAASAGARPGVIEPSGRVTSYSELSRASSTLRDHLAALDVRKGDRVGVYLRKSAESVASLLGALRAGAGYVPLDPAAPVSRNAHILADCAVKVVIVERQFADALRFELQTIGSSATFVLLDSVGDVEPVCARLDRLINMRTTIPVSDASVEASDLAYILYTSGSTGRPKGVTISHSNASSFVDWCSTTFKPTSDDRFSAHAPFHFDLSIFDIWVSLRHGATIVIIDEDLGKDPGRLAQYVADMRISIWYSAPSILSLLSRRGRLAEYDYQQLRLVLFAGEVFPVSHLRSLQRQWGHPKFYNLYGPTETNVCTFYEIPSIIPDDQTEPYPIGKVCSHVRGTVVDEQGRRLSGDREGELCIAGASVMVGYWGQRQMTERAFISDADGVLWYKTGDVVTVDEHGDYKYLGRRDRMVKKRGYRIELGEIECCLYQHPDIIEAAVVAADDEEAGVLIRAHVSTPDGKRLSLIKLKQFCSARLPVYMVPDQLAFHKGLPKTSTGKIDYQLLMRQ